MNKICPILYFNSICEIKPPLIKLYFLFPKWRTRFLFSLTSMYSFSFRFLESFLFSLCKFKIRSVSVVKRFTHVFTGHQKIQHYDLLVGLKAPNKAPFCKSKFWLILQSTPHFKKTTKLVDGRSNKKIWYF